MAFARIVIATTLFFFSLIGTAYLALLTVPDNYPDLDFLHNIAVLTMLMISLGIPAFVIRLAEKNTKFKEIFIACLAFVGLIMLEEFNHVRDYEQFVFFAFLLAVFSMMFSLFGFFLAEKIRSKNRTD